MPGIKNSKIPLLQRLSQIFPGTLGQNFYFPALWKKVPYGGWGKGLCVPTLNCYGCPLAVSSCPIGQLQHFIGIGFFPFLIVGTIAGFGLMLGRFFCGWFCPFGLVQDLLYKIKSTKVRIPKWLTYGPYIFLVVLVILVPLFTHTPWFCKLCPQGTLQAGIPWVLWNPADVYTNTPMFGGMVGTMFIIKIIILGGFLVSFVFIKRPFCRIVCPLGIILGLFNRISMMRMAVDEKCTTCMSCRDICPMGIDIFEEPNAVNCIRCLRCTACDAVHVTWIFGGREPVSMIKKQFDRRREIKEAAKY
ncbi:MAG: 4Fe-4S binding protein [Candidatus Coatesbacteria bacterium]|nr:MAG: 4Fe-4S binding protein [Candidatus Coatesbacteria bacterium]